MNAKAYLEMIQKGFASGDIKTLESFLERKDGSEEIVNVTADKTPAAVPAPVAKPAAPAPSAPKKDNRATPATPAKPKGRG